MKIILLENIRSLNNVGAIFRSADGAGFDRVILTGYSPTPPRKEIAKTALGAQESVSWEYFQDPQEALREYKKRWYTLISAEKNATSQDFRQLPQNQEKILIIMGNEVDGVSNDTLKQSNHTAHIPMHGIKESLNVSVAASILMYHFCK